MVDYNDTKLYRKLKPFKWRPDQSPGVRGEHNKIEQSCFDRLKSQALSHRHQSLIISIIQAGLPMTTEHAEHDPTGKDSDNQ